MWLEIPKLPGYFVSELGEVKGLRGGLCKFSNNKGYLALIRYKTAFKVHKLVADRFLPAPTDEGCEVHHIDRNRRNNKAENLMWVDRNYNAQEKGMYKNNTSGVKGICFIQSIQLWTAYKQKNKIKHRAYFKERKDAEEWLKLLQLQ